MTAHSGEVKDLRTLDIVKEMGIGINLGNTFESCGDWIDRWGDGTPNAYETAWGSPTVTREMIQGYADEGFGTLRIPVAWSNMMSKDGSYVISDAYTARVSEVIKWALDADLYVIMNLHWDGGWLSEYPTNRDECRKKYSAIWDQLCEKFKDYGDHLIFESQNEEPSRDSLWSRWTGDTDKAEAYGYVNEINQSFVNIVRSSGGNNKKRHLLISGYNAGIDLTCDALFRMPYDPASRCAVSVHYYTPAEFAILEEDADWAMCRCTWGTDDDYRELDRQMNMIKSSFVDKGIPVILGEYGCSKNNKDEGSVRRFISSVCEAALSCGGICPVLWDTTALHYDRNSHKMVDRQLHVTLLELRDKYAPAAPAVLP